jgi:hypothetical protein
MSEAAQSSQRPKCGRSKFEGLKSLDQNAIFKYFRTIGGILDFKFGMEIKRFYDS